MDQKTSKVFKASTGLFQDTMVFQTEKLYAKKAAKIKEGKALEALEAAKLKEAQALESKKSQSKPK